MFCLLEIFLFRLRFDSKNVFGPVSEVDVLEELAKGDSIHLIQNDASQGSLVDFPECNESLQLERIN